MNLDRCSQQFCLAKRIAGFQIVQCALRVGRRQIVLAQIVTLR